MKNNYQIAFPQENVDHLHQDEVYFHYWKEDPDKKVKLRFHDYAEIYKEPGLYEQLFYERLKCTSPAKISTLLKNALSQSQENISELRVLDFGAGNGMMGEELKTHGVSRLVGIDIVPEAKEATLRDRPGLYDNYYICDFENIDNKTNQNIKAWNCNCLVTVAALGFGDIPPKAFINAFNMIDNNGWIAFNIKETFLDTKDNTGFSKIIKELIFSEYLDIYNLERYRHRVSVSGVHLYYYAIVGRKNTNVPADFFAK